MKKKIIHTVVMIGVIVGTVIVQAFLSLWRIRLNLTILPVYFISLKKGTAEGTAFGAFTGLLEDMLSGGIIGPSLLAKGVSGMIVSNIPAVFYYWRPMIGLVAMVLITMFDDLVVYICLSLFTGQPVPVADFVSLTLGRSLFNAPFGLFFRYRTNE